MTPELFPDLEPCGCRRGEGHVCRVPWMTVDEWGTPQVRSCLLCGSMTINHVCPVRPGSKP